MNKRLVATNAAGIMLLFFNFALVAAQKEYNWNSGQLLAAQMSGHGSSSAGKSAAKAINKRADIWWTYCISDGVQTYSAVSRETPAQIGLERNTPVKFVANKSRLTVLDAEGERHDLIILRVNKGKDCQ
jgi:hypothetical protein